MHLVRLSKSRSVKFRLFTMKLMFTLFLILQTAQASLKEIYKKFGYDTPKEVLDVQLKLENYNRKHFIFKRWLEGGFFGQMAGLNSCKNCRGVYCTPLSPEEMPLLMNVPRTKPCDPPEGQDTDWEDVSKKLFECLCDPEMELSEKWKTRVLEPLRNKARTAFYMDIPDARNVGRFQFRACALEGLISRPFENPYLLDCPGSGEQDLLTGEEKVTEWIQMDMLARKRIFELETIPCYTESIANMVKAITKYHETQELAPPEVDIEPESGIATLKKPFGYLRAGDEILIDTKYTSDSELLISAVMDLEEVRKDPKFLGYFIEKETMHIYCASERNVNSVYPQIESLNEPDEPQELCYEGEMVPAEYIEPFYLVNLNNPDVLAEHLEDLYEEETMGAA